MNRKMIMGAAAAAGGALALGLGAWALWNSRRMRWARVTRAAGCVLHRAGGVLQAMGDTMC